MERQSCKAINIIFKAAIKMQRIALIIKSKTIKFHTTSQYLVSRNHNTI